MSYDDIMTRENEMKDTIKHTKRVYYTLLFIFWFATGLPAALTVLLMLARGLTLYQVSILMAIYSVTIVLLEVPTGGLADAIGRKKVALFAYGFMLLSSIAMLLAFSFPVFMLGWVLYGIGRALASGAMEAWFIDQLQASQADIDLQSVIAQGNTFILLGLGLGLFAGSGMSQALKNLPPDGTAILTPYSIPIAMAAVVMMVLLGVTLSLVKEKISGSQAFSPRQALKDTKTILKTGFDLSRKSRVIPLLMGASFMLGIAMTNLETFWQPHFSGLMDEHNRNNLMFGVIEGGSFAIGILGNQFSIPLKRWLGGRLGWMCALMQLLWGSGMVILASQSVLLPGIAFYWIVRFAISAHDSPHMALLNNEIPSEQRSAMLSISSMVAYLGVILGSLLMGLLAEIYGITTVWAIDGILLVGAVLFYGRIEKVLQQGQDQIQVTREEEAYV